MEFGIFFSLVFIFAGLSSCEGKTNYIEIPFVLENKRIAIEATINGQKGKFVFDTGSTESYLDIKVTNLSRYGHALTPYKGRQISTPIYNLKKITFGGIELKTRSWMINHSDLITRSQNDGFDGILGVGIFEGYWCELSFSKSKIILYKENPGSFVNFSPVKILNKYNADFFIPCVIDGVTFYFDIDTGAPDGLYFPGGLVKIKKDNECREIASTDLDVPVFYLVKTDEIRILDETYTKCFVMTNSIYSARDDETYHDFGVFGIDFLKHYDFLFDYRKLREGKSTGMYYKPNTPRKERDYGVYSFINEAPEFGILNSEGFTESGFVVHRIIKDSIAYKAFGLRPGMTVSKINGKPIAEISREELFEPSFYLTVDNYTVLEYNTERTIPSPLKNSLLANP
jgi:hypothetical protein